MKSMHYICCFFLFIGAGAEKLLKFKKWFWSIVEKMTSADRQDLVSATPLLKYFGAIFNHN